MSFRLTEKQERATRLLLSDARHIMLYGGSRSGKTLLLLRSIVERALACKSRHAILRFRFNHIRQSIAYDTLPKVLDVCFPDMEKGKLNRTEWVYTFPNGSEIWLGGLDEKERTEKILGQEYATIFLNECSQIPWASRNIAMTRLAQKTPLPLKAYYDCNPPSEGHWTYKLFIAGRHPDTRAPLADPNTYTAYQINPADNQDNLPPDYLEELEELPERQRRRFLLGEFGAESEGALWTIELIEQARFHGTELPQMQRIVIAVDPSGCAGPEDARSDEIGIVVCGLGVDGQGYVLEDLSGRFGPAEWGRLAAEAYDRHAADCIVAEVNFGGAMVGEVIRAAQPGIPFREVTASRGKAVRAEPIATLFERKKVVLAGRFPRLEDQLCAMTMAGYVGDRSPDRADAMIWGITYLFPGIARHEERARQRPPVVQVGYSQAKQRRA